MLRQGFSRCYCDFNATISRSSTRKVPSCSLRIHSAVHISASEEVKSLELVDHTENLRVSLSRLTRIEQESALDPVSAKLRQVILEGWPGKVHECDPVLRPFFQFRDALVVQGNLVFRGPRLFVPSSLIKEFMSLAHSSHIGLGGAFVDLASACSGPE